MGKDLHNDEGNPNTPNIVIQVLDPIECSVSKENGMLLRPCLTYPASYWKDGKFHKEEVEYEQEAFTYKRGDNWRFLTGLLPRIRKYCQAQDLPLQILGETTTVPDYEETHAAGNYTLRKDQFDLVNKVPLLLRGVIKAPTGMGKTIIQLGIFEWFHNSTVLLLAHTSNIVIQTAKKFDEEGFDVQRIGGGKQFSGKFTSDIVISTRQSFAKINPKLYCDHFDIVMIDETHHVSTKSGQYAKILKSLLCPIRLGFTATLENEEVKPQAAFTCEGFLGPVIGEVTMEEAQNLGILAKPRVKLKKSPESSSIRRLTKYPDVYQSGIVANYDRNRIIMDSVHEHVVKGDTVLVFVKTIQHAGRLESMARGYKSLKDCTKVVKGSVSATVREDTRLALGDKTVKCVISTVVWQEGIDVPSLDVIWNAGAGKDEKDTLQKVGRGLRKADGKEEVVIYDIFDPSHPYLVKHFGHRVSLYMDNGWL